MKSKSDYQTKTAQKLLKKTKNKIKLLIVCLKQQKRITLLNKLPIWENTKPVRF